MSGSTVLLADGTLSDFGTKFWEVLQALAIFLGVLALIFFAAGRAVGRISRPLTITVFLGPAILLIMIGLIVPAIRTIYLSTKNSDSTKGVGLDNYTWAFTNGDIQRVLINTLLWIVIAPVVTTVLGLAVALMVDRLKGQAIYKSLIFMPMAISFVGASIIWKFVYEARDPSQPQIGGSRRYSDEDIARLRRIQELTNHGLNLAGVQMVLSLEAELTALRQALAEARARAEEAVERTHRQYRRDLVPLRQSVALYQRKK